MIKGRGSSNNPQNPFSKDQYQEDPEFLEHQQSIGEDPQADQKTTYTLVDAKSIVNPVHSPDIGHKWSLNPYQGCEHGCSYCYARNSHTYWSMNAGLDFERKIMVKQNAPVLLRKHFDKKSWQGEAIMLSGNTDCYQPLERRFGITRELLKVFLEYRNPVGIISKNALMERDLDILEEMGKYGLVKVAISLNSLDENLRRKLEPRTASAKKRLQLISKLSERRIPIMVMAAPIIPGLNSHEIFEIAKASAEAGAQDISYIMVRLNGQLQEIFNPWLENHYPDRAEKVRSLIRQTHAGQLNDSQFGRRMKGSGQVAEQIQQSIKLAKKKFFPNPQKVEYNQSLFRRMPGGQYNLF